MMQAKWLGEDVWVGPKKGVHGGHYGIKKGDVREIFAKKEGRYLLASGGDAGKCKYFGWVDADDVEVTE